MRIFTAASGSQIVKKSRNFCGAILQCLKSCLYYSGAAILQLLTILGLGSYFWTGKEIRNICGAVLRFLKSSLYDSRAAILPLMLILGLGCYFRIGVGLRWDENHLLHPDERFLTMVTAAIDIPPSIEEYFATSTSGFNPHNRNYNLFVYGTLPIFITKILSVWVGMPNYGDLQVVGRVLSSMFDIATIFLVFLLGARVFGVFSGLLGAAALAFCVLHVQLSHFYGVETSVAFFVTLTFYLMLRTWDEPHLHRGSSLRIMGSALCCGIAFGAALASKISAAFLGPIIALAVLYHGYNSLSRLNYSASITPRQWLALIGNFAFPPALTLIATFITFRVLQPYAFADHSLTQLNPKWLANMKEVAGLMAGADFPPSIHWVDRTPILFSLGQMYHWWFGKLATTAAWLGVALALFTGIRTRSPARVLIATWILLWFTYQSSQFVKAGRYLSMIYPFFAVLCGYFLATIAEQGTRFLQNLGVSSRVSKSMGYAPAAVVSASLLIWSIALTNIYRNTHSRVAASRWIYANIPCGKTLANEHWDDGLPLGLDGRGFSPCYNGVEMENYGVDTPEKLSDTISKLSKADYLILSSNRLYGNIPRLPRRFPFTIEYYRMLFAGELGFSPVETFTSYPTFLGHEFNTDASEEIFTVYDHPKVFIFKKDASFDPERVRSRLSEFPPGVIEPLVKRRSL